MESRPAHLLAGAALLATLVVIAAAAVWTVQRRTVAARTYDVFFRQSVAGLAPGSAVTLEGVPAGKVDAIEIWAADPALVRVRLAIDQGVPVLAGTGASLASVGLTGVRKVTLSGASRKAAALGCPGPGPSPDCPTGVPVIPARAGGIDALLQTAPELVGRFSELSERTGRLLSERNRRSAGAIGGNVRRLSRAFAARGEDVAVGSALREATGKVARAAEQVRALRLTARSVGTEVGSLRNNFARLKASAAGAGDTVAGVAADLRPGLRRLRTETLPEARALAEDLHSTSAAIGRARERARQEGAASLLGPPALPDYQKR